MRAVSQWGAALALGAGLGAAALVGARRAEDRRFAAELSGKIALVTGGTRGLGLELALLLGRAGCRVVICGRDGATLERARELLVARGVEVLARRCDVTHRGEVEQLVREAGPVDLLFVNAVSGLTVGPIESQTVEDFVAVHDVLFWGALYSVLAVLPQMRARRSGRIAFITSASGRIATPHLLPYSTAKYAVSGLAAGLRSELHGSGITVTAVAPSFVRTGFFLHGSYAGRPEAEFSWFARGELAPLLSISAASAARQTLRAVLDGAAERVIGPSAALVTRLYQASPNLGPDLTGSLHEAVQPDPPSIPRRARGLDLERRTDDWLLRLLMHLRRPTLRQLNQYPDQPPVLAGGS